LIFSQSTSPPYSSSTLIRSSFYNLYWWKVSTKQADCLLLHQESYTFFIASFFVSFITFISM
jgi:hypothetical protein